MRKRSYLVAGGVAVGFLVALELGLFSNASRRSAAEARQELRRQGFKTDLSDFDFSTSPELRIRESTLANAFDVHERREQLVLERGLLDERFWRISENAALPVWAPARPVPRSVQTGWDLKDDVWPALRAGLERDREALDRACAAAIAGPIRFHLDAARGIGMPYKHLMGLRTLSTTLAARVLLGLHVGDAEVAWTNVLSVTRLATGYLPEPTLVSHLTQTACGNIAGQAMWQWVQSRHASDEQLARLQHEWEQVDYLRGLPETAAFERACATAVCHEVGEHPFRDLGDQLEEALSSAPRLAPLVFCWEGLKYRLHGVYADEAVILRQFRDLEQQLREAALAPNWLRIPEAPTVAAVAGTQSQSAPTQSPGGSAKHSMLFLFDAEQYRMLLARVAEAECRRRVVVAALAVERYRAKHGAYPAGIEDVVPEFLPMVPLDFADSRPLRYRHIEQGSYLLYSVGLDCTDDGGVVPVPRRPGGSGQGAVPSAVGQKGADVVWPRLATEADVRAQLESKRHAADAEAKAEE